MKQESPEGKEKTVSNVFLQQARAERFWTQADVTKRTNISERMISSLERGERLPSLSLLGKLCELFDKPPEQLGYTLNKGQVERVMPPSEPALTSQPDAVQPVSLEDEGKPPLFPLSPAAAASSPEATSQLLPEGEAHHQSFGPRHISRSIHPQMHENRWWVLKQVRMVWIEGVLRQSLKFGEPITMNFLEHREALANPWQFEAQETNLPSRPISCGTSILQIYDETEGDLLILGESDAGKSTQMFMLAEQLAERAEQGLEDRFPVIFPLCSWADRQLPLVEWLVEEFREKYGIEPDVARDWIEHDQLIVLLDGLNEVAEKAQPACVKAIDTYKRAHERTPLVISSRTDAYFSQDTRLKLQRAIIVQPLSTEQIETYFASTGSQLAVVRKILEDDPVLKEMIRVPSMLRVVAETYQDKDLSMLKTNDSLEDRRRQIFAHYVSYRFGRGARSCYTLQQTSHWLAWIADQLTRHEQKEYTIERMQPDWLPDEHTRQRYQKMVRRSIYGLESAIVAALFAWVRGGKSGSGVGVGSGLFGQLGGGPGNLILGWMASGIGGGVEGGGSLGILLALACLLLTLFLGSASLPTISLRACRSGFIKGLRTGGMAAAISSVIYVLLFSALGGFGHGLPYGMSMALFSGLVIGLLRGLYVGLRAGQQISEDSTGRRARPFGECLVDGLIIGLCAGVSFGLVMGMLRIWLTSALIYGFIAGLFFFLAFGFGGGCELLGALGTEIQPAERVTWSWRQAGRAVAGSMKKSLGIGLVLTGCVSVVLGCASGLFYGVHYGMRYGLVYGLIVGLVAGVAATLTEVLKSGWSSHLLARHQLRRPNEGIRRSFTHALFAAGLFGPLGGLASGLVCGGAFGLVARLSGWGTLGLGFAVVFGCLFALQFGMVYGGIACLEHYLLRWYLWRNRRIPWDLVAFLNEATRRVFLRKVWGSYIFAYPLLRDYFASLDAAGEQQSEEVPDDPACERGERPTSLAS